MVTVRYFGCEGVPQHATGAVGGRLQDDEYVVRFFTEVPELRDEVYDRDGTQVLQQNPPDVRREIVASIVMSGRTAHEVHEWLGRMISDDPGEERDLRRRPIEVYHAGIEKKKEACTRKEREERLSALHRPRDGDPSQGHHHVRRGA